MEIKHDFKNRKKHTTSIEDSLEGLSDEVRQDLTITNSICSSS